MARTILDAALHYTRRGLPVFPLNPLNKHPYLAGGFKVATTTEQVVRDWWQQFPKAMIGMPTGTASKLWVVDVDVDPGKKLDGSVALAKLTSKHGPLPVTLISQTPRGGAHYVFAWNGVDIRNSTGQVGRGIDVRAEGGYVCLPPSRRADGARYRWEKTGADQAAVAPDWLIDLAKPRDRGNAWARTALGSRD